MVVSILGLWISALVNLMRVAVYLVHAFVLKIAFNSLAPFIAEKFEINLPFTSITTGKVWALFIIIHFIGMFIKMLIPKFSKDEEKKKS